MNKRGIPNTTVNNENQMTKIALEHGMNTPFYKNLMSKEEKREIYHTTRTENRNKTLNISGKNTVTFSGDTAKPKIFDANLFAYIGYKKVSLGDLDANLLQFATKTYGPSNEIVYHCKKCPVKAHSETNIKEHIEKHVDNISFLCADCGFRMKKREEFRSTDHIQFCKKMKNIT